MLILTGAGGEVKSGLRNTRGVQRRAKRRGERGRRMGGPRPRAEKIPDRSRGGLTYAATCSAVRGGPSYWCGLVSASGVEGRAGLLTPAMKRSTSLIALSMERQG